MKGQNQDSENEKLNFVSFVKLITPLSKKQNEIINLMVDKINNNQRIVLFHPTRIGYKSFIKLINEKLK